MACGSCGHVNAFPGQAGGGWPTVRGKLTKMKLAELKAMATKLQIVGRSKATTKKALIELIIAFKK